MVKIMAKRYAIGIALNMLLVIVVGILHAIILNIIPISEEGLTIFCYILGAIVAIPATIVVLYFCSSLLMVVDINDDVDYEGKCDYWKNRLEEGNPVKFIKVLICILPMLLITCVCIFIMIYCYKPFYNMIVRVLDELAKQQGAVNSSHCAFHIFPATILSASAVMWFIYFLRIVIHYAKATCPKCGNLFSYCDGEYISGSYHHDEKTEHKYEDRYGKVGELYLGNEKIGDVRGKTGTVSYERTIKSSVYANKGICRYCGREKKIYHGSAVISNWK